MKKREKVAFQNEHKIIYFIFLVFVYIKLSNLQERSGNKNKKCMNIWWKRMRRRSKKGTRNKKMYNLGKRDES